MKRDVSDMLRTLIRTQEAKDANEPVNSEAPGDLTALGAALIRKSERHYLIDLTPLRVFRNLHMFVQLLVDEVIEQCGFGIADIMVRRRVDPNLTPELTQTGLDWIMIYVRLDAADHLPFDYRNLTNRMQVIFRTLQTEKWGGILFPEFYGIKTENAQGEPPALLFPFHLHDPDEQSGSYYLVELNRPGRFLRITMEDAADSRLQLKHIPHRVVDQTVRGSYLADIYPTAEKIHQGMLREAMNNRSEYSESPLRLPDFFAHLRKEGLPDLQAVHFSWPTDDRQILFLEGSAASAGPTKSLELLVKEIQLLEDPRILHLLARGSLLEMVSGSFHIYFDVSRYGGCLNVSFGALRTVLTLDDYLAQMPSLSRRAALHKNALSRVRLFLIHHITAEVIGLIRAFAEAGCESLISFFVKYAGVVPEAYLETLMSLPPETFRFFSLQKIESPQKLGGLYRYSRQFTPLAGLEEIDDRVLRSELDFLGSMRLAAGHIFLKEAALARQKGESLLLVEDGGYLAPLINRFCLEHKTAGEVFDYFHVPREAGDENLSIASWLSGTLLGSVEHTKNGYDYNADVMREFGKLQFPAASIAVSALKRGPEARECAMSILQATESILNRLGLLVSRRTIAVLGSRGAIGGFLKQELGHRLPAEHLYGVDIAAPENVTPFTEVRTIADLGRDVLNRIDMFIGVTGASVLKPDHIEDIILHTPHRAVFFVSGSTKTVEFSDVQNYLQSLCDAAEPHIGGRTVSVDFMPLRDLQTGVLQGYQAAIVFPDDPARNKLFYLLGEGMPINFLYYGIPREIVDEVMTQLFTVSCGMVRRERSDDKLRLALLAVDYEIDENAAALPSGGEPEV
ncbi:MAG: hypothetical protein EG826_13060 [Deltaproteobacteria bacterium]|nr:hypothetical protein [Deltaproteobacteria bacterium]